MKRLCVFCGSSPGHAPVYLQAARELGTEMARRGLGLVYGGASIGLMGAVADAVLAGGAEVIGVLPRPLALKEVAHEGLTELMIVESMHERKARMEEAADGFVALPGGMGTFEEFCEIVTWSQLGVHLKPCGLLNVKGYYDLFLSFLDRAVEDGFLRPEHRALVLEGERPSALLDLVQTWVPPAIPRVWLRESQT